VNYLMICVCGHSLEEHEVDGCGHRGKAPCACPRAPGAALEAAIDGAALIEGWDRKALKALRLRASLRSRENRIAIGSRIGNR
jgi:hypothetical protein